MDLDLPSRPVSADAEKEEGVFSIVVPPSDTKSRRLPSTYVGNYQVFASRDVAQLQERLRRSVEAALESERRWVYVARACDIDGRRGLYCHDFFNRSPFMRRLHRAGLRFSEDPYVVLGSDGRFQSADFDAFEADFVIMGSLDPEESSVHEASAAWLAFNVGGLRVGKITPDEFSVLLSALKGAQAIGSGSAALVVAELQAS